MHVRADQHSINLFDDHDFLLGRLTFFQLPSDRWLLEQLFFPGRYQIKYVKILIVEFLKQIPVTIDKVIILDPTARNYLNNNY